MDRPDRQDFCLIRTALAAPYRHSRVSGNPERYCVRQVHYQPGIWGFPLTREGRWGRLAAEGR